MANVALSYDIPFVKRVTMPENWARWLSQRGKINDKLTQEPVVNDIITWDYDKHGLAPWMQFFFFQFMMIGENV